MKWHRQTGMAAFTTVWVGQVVSLFGTNMTRFTLMLWSFEITGRATTTALVGFFSFAPVMLLSPLAGVLVDRWDRKIVMILSDLAAGASTVAILALHLTGHLQVWHFFALSALAGAFEAFQFPAYSAAISVMLPKEQYVRASGMLSLASDGGRVLAPIAAGVLLGVIGISGVLIVDIATFSIAILTLLAIHVPKPPPSEAGREAKGSLWRQMMFGFGYIFARPSLIGLQLAFFAVNAIGTFAFTVLTPMVLSRTGNNTLALGTVRSSMGLGGVLGGLLLSVWGGPKRRIHGVLAGLALACLFGMIVTGVGRSTFVWAIGAFLAYLFVPIINGSNQAIWQAKVPPDVQGRVFASRQVVAQLSSPMMMLAAGPLADYVFEPSMAAGGVVRSLFGPLVGSGPGTGMAAMFVIAGVAGTLVSILFYAIPAVRNAEELLPDYDACAAGVTSARS